MTTTNFQSIYTHDGHVVVMLAGVQVWAWRDPGVHGIEWCEQRALEALAYRIRKLLNEAA